MFKLSFITACLDGQIYSQEDLRESYIRQLIPTSIALAKIKLKIFGHSGVGKTALISSLQVKHN